LAAALLVAPLAAANAQQIVGRDQEVFTWSGAVTRGAWFGIVIPQGDVTVSQATGNQVEVRAEKVRGARNDIGFVVVRNGDDVLICAVYDDDDECSERGVRTSRRWRGTSPRLEVTIRLPAGVRVRAQTGHGDVAVTNAGSDAHASSGNGEVRVNGAAGEVTAASGNGRVTVENARGPVRASSGNGDITVRTSVGPVTASSGNGDLFVTMDTLRGDDDMEFTTGNGRIVLTIPANFSGEIDASTGNGSVVTDFPIQVTGRISRTRVRGTIGQGGRRVRLVSGNGSIELRRP
ncbi:MAG TPA: DUF4097 family beta strand repeat-containing protein, partial [Gemmatimonadaceae bacterium]